MLFLAEPGEFCANTANVWQLLGHVVTIIKIVIPLILIVLGMLDLGKAVIGSDDKAISKAVSSLLQRFIAALVMFFIPTIVSAIFNAITSINLNEDANVCVQCLTNAGSDYCDGYADAVEGSLVNNSSDDNQTNEG